MQHIIVGAGPAGVIAAETLSRFAPQDTITLIGDEREPPYSRMAIPYFLVENIQESGTFLRRNNEHYQQQGIRLVQDKVSSVDANGKTIALESGGSHNQFTA